MLFLARFYGAMIAALAVVVAVMFALGALAHDGDDKPIEQSGRASWYGHPQRVACGGKGARFDPNAFTAAHLKVHEWGCGTRLLVTNTRNGKSVEVILFDHGPASWTGNIIDLSRGAFREIEDLKRGLADVVIVVLELKPPAPRRNRQKV